MDAKTSQQVSPLSFACVSVWDAPRVARFRVILEKRREDRLRSGLPRVEMGVWRDYATLSRAWGFFEAFRPKRAQEMKVARLHLHK